ncbi:MAG: insulinase family protein [Chlorobi bacterium]|nr:insulinase family protein [Chlorobiota bacterium]
MRRQTCSFVLAAVIMLGFTGMNEAVSQGIFPYKYSVVTLENGLKAYLIPTQNPGLVAYYSIVRTGSRDEWEPGHSGFAHFFEHMMFRGTKTYPGPVYDRLVTEMGADANAYTTDDYTAYHLKFAREDLERVMELESDRFQNLFYEEPEFITEAGAVYGEFRKGRTNPWWVLFESIQNTAFDVHTYKHTTIGFEADIKAMPTMYEYSKSFFRRYYRPENVVLLIAGDIDIEATKSLVEKYYADWKPGYVAPQIPVEPEQKGERKVEVKYDGKTLPIVAISYKSPAFDPDNKLAVAGYLIENLAFGETSDIYKKLVLQEQKVQVLGASFDKNRDPGLWSIYAMVKDKADIPYVLGEIDKAVEKMRNAPVEARRLNDLKSRLKYGFLMNLDTPGKVAGNLARYVALTGGIEAVDRLFATYEKVTPADVQNAARTYLVKDHRTVATLKGRD